MSVTNPLHTRGRVASSRHRTAHNPSSVYNESIHQPHGSLTPRQYFDLYANVMEDESSISHHSVGSSPSAPTHVTYIYNQPTSTDYGVGMYLADTPIRHHTHGYANQPINPYLSLHNPQLAPPSHPNPALRHPSTTLTPASRTIPSQSAPSAPLNNTHATRTAVHRNTDIGPTNRASLLRSQYNGHTPSYEDNKHLSGYEDTYAWPPPRLEDFIAAGNADDAPLDYVLDNDIYRSDGNMYEANDSFYDNAAVPDASSPTQYESYEQVGNEEISEFHTQLSRNPISSPRKHALSANMMDHPTNSTANTHNHHYQMEKPPSSRDVAISTPRMEEAPPTPTAKPVNRSTRTSPSIATVIPKHAIMASFESTSRPQMSRQDAYPSHIQSSQISSQTRQQLLQTPQKSLRSRQQSVQTPTQLNSAPSRSLPVDRPRTGKKTAVSSYNVVKERNDNGLGPKMMMKDAEYTRDDEVTVIQRPIDVTQRPIDVTQRPIDASQRQSNISQRQQSPPTRTDLATHQNMPLSTEKPWRKQVSNSQPSSAQKLSTHPVVDNFNKSHHRSTMMNDLSFSNAPDGWEIAYIFPKRDNSEDEALRSSALPESPTMRPIVAAMPKNTDMSTISAAALRPDATANLSLVSATGAVALTPTAITPTTATTTAAATTADAHTAALPSEQGSIVPISSSSASEAATSYSLRLFAPVSTQVSSSILPSSQELQGTASLPEKSPYNECSVDSEQQLAKTPSMAHVLGSDAAIRGRLTLYSAKKRSLIQQIGGSGNLDVSPEILNSDSSEKTPTQVSVQSGDSTARETQMDPMLVNSAIPEFDTDKQPENTSEVEKPITTPQKNVVHVGDNQENRKITQIPVEIVSTDAVISAVNAVYRLDVTSHDVIGKNDGNHPEFGENHENDHEILFSEDSLSTSTVYSQDLSVPEENDMLLAYATLRNECQTLRSERETLRSECETLRNKCETLHSKCEMLHSECETLNGKNEAFEAIRNELSLTLQEKERQLRESAEREKKTEENTSQMTRQLQNLSGELSSAQQLIQTLRSELDAQTIAADNAQLAITKASEEAALVNMENLRLKTENSQIATENSQIATENSVMRDRIKTLETVSAELTAQIETLEQQQLVITSEREQHRQECISLRSQLAASNTANTQLREEINTSLDEMKALQQDINASNGKIQDLSSETSLLREKLSRALESEAESLKACEVKVGEIESKCNTRIDSLRVEYEAETSTLRASHERRLAHLREQQEMQLQVVKEEHSLSLQKLQRDLERKYQDELRGLKTLQRENEEEKNRITALTLQMQEREKAIVALQNDVTRLKDTNCVLKSSLDEHTNVSNECSRLKKIVANLQEELETKNFKLQFLEDNMGLLEQKRSLLASEAQVLEQRYAEKCEELNVSSREWKDQLDREMRKFNEMEKKLHEATEKAKYDILSLESKVKHGEEVRENMSFVVKEGESLIKVLTQQIHDLEQALRQKDVHIYQLEIKNQHLAEEKAVKEQTIKLWTDRAGIAEAKFEATRRKTAEIQLKSEQERDKLRELCRNEYQVALQRSNEAYETQIDRYKQLVQKMYQQHYP